MLTETRRGRSGINIWPGYVDALATLLLMFIFILSLFMVAQLYLSDALTDRDASLERLRGELTELSDMLALEKRERQQVETRLTASIGTSRRLEQELAAASSQASELRGELEQRDAFIGELGHRIAIAQEDLSQQRQLSRTAQARVEQLSEQVRELREQLTRVSQALQLSEGTVAEQRAEIERLGDRLNVALAEKVQELHQYRSEFFGRLREVLGDRDDIRIVGDRFLFQSELFFETASAELGEPGKQQLDQVAQALLEIRQRIPDDISWVLQVEGHTDRRPISTAQFPSNWQLSSARAQAIVNYLIARGVPPHRLAATGFAQFHPVDDRDTPEAWHRNRRIELKLTSR